MGYWNSEHYNDPTAGKAINNVMRGSYMRKNMKNLIKQAKSLEKSKDGDVIYDYNKLTIEELHELLNENI